MCQKFVFRSRVLLALNEPHMKHRVSVKITLNMLLISQKRNVSSCRQVQQTPNDCFVGVAALNNSIANVNF